MSPGERQETVLLTGGAGFLGRALASRLRDLGAHVSVLDVLVPKVHGTDADRPAALDGVDFRRADVRDTEAVTAAIKGADIVVHLAAETGVGTSMYDVRHHVDVNATGTATVLEAIARARQRPRRFLLCSSRAVYGEGAYSCNSCGTVAPHGRIFRDVEGGSWHPTCPNCRGECRSVPTPESLPLVPASVYGATKVAQEHLVRTLLPALGVESVIVRHFNVYGPGQSLTNPFSGILATFFVQAQHGGPIEVYEDGEESRDFVYIDDAVQAMALALSSPAAGGQIINVGTGVATTLLELARRVIKMVGSDSTVHVSGAFRAGDVRHATADVQRSASVLGHVSDVPLAVGLSRYLDWARATAPAPSDATARARDELVGHDLLRVAR